MSTQPSRVATVRSVVVSRFFSAGLALPAQTATARSSVAAMAVEREEAVQLSPFTAVSDHDRDYRAEITLAGSRLNSSLKDTPGVLDVLTKDFLDDIGATTLEQALAFATNFAEDAGDYDSQGVINTIFPGSQINVNFRTRGLGGPMARNYLPTDSRPPNTAGRGLDTGLKFDFFANRVAVDLGARNSTSRA